MKKAEEVMGILEAYDLAGALRGAAALAACDHKTVAHWVRMREQAGEMPAVERRRPAVGDFVGKIDEPGRAFWWPDPGGCRVRQAGRAWL